MAAKARTPRFLWAQSLDHIYLKIDLTDVPKDAMKTTVTRDDFKWAYAKDDAQYEVEFKFRFPVNPDSVKIRHMRVVEFIFEKETSDAFWPHILHADDKKRLKAQCKVDWNLFKDEDELREVDKPGGGDMFGGMGGMPGMGGMGGMPGMGGMDFGDFSNLGGDEDDEEDSDDGPIPGVDDDVLEDMAADAAAKEAGAPADGEAKSEETSAPADAAPAEEAVEDSADGSHLEELD